MKLYIKTSLDIFKRKKKTNNLKIKFNNDGWQEEEEKNNSSCCYYVLFTQLKLRKKENFSKQTKWNWGGKCRQNRTRTKRGDIFFLSKQKLLSRKREGNVEGKFTGDCVSTVTEATGLGRKRIQAFAWDFIQFGICVRRNQSTGSTGGLHNFASKWKGWPTFQARFANNQHLIIFLFKFFLLFFFFILKRQINQINV